MARVKEDVRREAAEMIDQLPDEILGTCGLCNRTLFNELTQIEVKSGAPQMTVCEIFASRYNRTKREEDQVTAKAFRDRMQYLARVNARELSAESQQITKDTSTPESNNSSTVAKECGDSSQSKQEEPEELNAESQQISEKSSDPPEKNNPANGVSEEHDADSESDQPDQRHTTVTPESTSTPCPTKDPYDVLVEFWRTKQYSAEDVYEVFLTDLLGRFSPEDVDQYRRDAGVSLDELSVIIGKTLRENAGLSPEEVHHVIRNGLVMYGGWGKTKADKALGSAPLLPGQLSPGDF